MAYKFGYGLSHAFCTFKTMYKGQCLTCNRRLKIVSLRIIPDSLRKIRNYWIMSYWLSSKINWYPAVLLPSFQATINYWKFSSLLWMYWSAWTVPSLYLLITNMLKRFSSPEIIDWLGVRSEIDWKRISFLVYCYILSVFAMLFEHWIKCRWSLNYKLYNISYVVKLLLFVNTIVECSVMYQRYHS